MKSVSKYFTLFNLIAVLLHACRPDPPVNNGQCTGCVQYHVSDVKNWLYFQPGTYWIYEEATSGAIDSVYVTSDTYDDGNPESAFFRCETFSSYYQYYFNYLSDNSSTCDNTFWGEKRCVFVRRDKTRPGDFVGETYAFFYRPRVGDDAEVVYSSSIISIVSVISILDSIIINGEKFNNVVLMDETDNITEDFQHTRFYFKENIGIIKKEMLDSLQTWNLVRYNIIQ